MKPERMIDKLQERMVLRWLVAYAAVAWGLAEATGLLIDNYGLSRTLLDVVLFLILVSFFVLLVLVWFHGQRGPQRVTRLEGGLLGVLLVIAIGGSLWIASGEASANPGRLSNEDVVADLGAGSVAVLPFHNEVEDRQFTWLARGVPELLSTHLAQHDGLRVVSGQRVFDILRQLGVAEDEAVPEGLERRVTELSGARLAITGSVFGGADDLTMTSSLSDVSTGEIRASANARGSDVFTLVDEVSRGLLRQIRGEADAPGLATVAQLTTGDVEAYRAYDEGRQALMRFRYDDAAEHFGRAVEIDSTFSLAHFRLALALYSTGQVFEATQHAQLAQRGIGRVSERDSLFIEGFSAFPRDTVSSIATLRDLVRLYPDEKDGRIMFAGLLAQIRGPADPEARGLLNQAVRLDPLYAAGYNLLAYSYAGAGDFEAADSLNQRYVDLEPGEPNPIDSRGEILEFAGRRQEARSAYLEALRLQPDFLFALDHLTRLHLTHGDPAAARADLDSRLDSASPDVRVRARILMGDTYLWEGAFDEGLAAYTDAEQEAVASERPDLRAMPLADVIRTHLAVGDYPAATEAAREIRTVQPLSGWWITVLYDSLNLADDLAGMERWKPRVEAEIDANPLTRPNLEIISRLLDVLIAHQRGQHELVLALAADLPLNLRPGALTGWPVFQSMIELGLGELLLEALQPFRDPNPFARGSRIVPLVDRSALYFEGRAYEMLGDTARAVARYEELVRGMGEGIERLHFLRDAPDRLEMLLDQVR